VAATAAFPASGVNAVSAAAPSVIKRQRAPRAQSISPPSARRQQ
jgi:hypothetical protein